MTKSEFIAKYGNRKVKFSSYYKYSFTFVDGKGLTIRVGGDRDDIYRFSVTANEEVMVSTLDPFSGECGEDNFYDY